MSLFEELKRRNVFRAAIAYVVAAWLILQVADVILPNVGAPDWVFKVILLALAIGLPLVLIIAWAFELTAEGFKRDTEVARAESAARNLSLPVDIAIITVLAILVAYLAYDKFFATAAYSDNSIAVLPFNNVSDDKDQEYFADGLSEELLNMLAKIPALRVIARTSSFSYKGENKRIAEIADELDVNHVLEGSVRKYDGAKVRITTQLVRAEDESHLWSNVYDVTLEDVFAVQDRIAVAVVDQLKVRLLGAAPTAQEIDPEAYERYLQARGLSRQSTPEGYVGAIKLYNETLELEPDYAPAWAGLSENYVYLAEKVLLDSIRTVFQETRCTRNNELNTGQEYTPSIDQTFEEARCAAHRALASDPKHAPAHASLGRIAMGFDGDLAAAARHLERALQLDPRDSRIIRQAATFSGNLHRLGEAIELLEDAVAGDPVSPAVHSNLALNYYYAGRFDESIAAYRRALDLSPDAIGYYSWIGIAQVMNNDPTAGLKSINEERHPDTQRDYIERRPWRLIGQVIANHALGRSDDSDEKLRRLIDDYGEEWAFSVAYAVAFRGEADRAFEWLAKAKENNDSGLSEIASEPAFENIRSDPRWLPFLESVGKAPSQLAAIEFRINRPDPGKST